MYLQMFLLLRLSITDYTSRKAHVFRFPHYSHPAHTFQFLICFTINSPGRDLQYFFKVCSLDFSTKIYRFFFFISFISKYKFNSFWFRINSIHFCLFSFSSFCFSFYWEWIPSFFVSFVNLCVLGVFVSFVSLCVLGVSSLSFNLMKLVFP